MMQDLRFLPEVEDDAFAGYAWYEEKEQGLGDEFLRTRSPNYPSGNSHPR
jgi:hypothetical protein